MSEIAPPASVQDEVMEFLLTSPSPQQIIDFHASDVAQERLRYLLEANRNGTLTEAGDPILEPITSPLGRGGAEDEYDPHANSWIAPQKTPFTQSRIWRLYHLHNPLQPFTQNSPKIASHGEIDPVSPL